MKEVTTLHGKETGPTSIIMAGVHGNEPCGLKAFESMLPILEIDAGKVYFVVGNPNALANNVRYTELNLNRSFGIQAYSPEERMSYEWRRAQFLRWYLSEASALLDIHSTTDDNPPFVICEPNGVEIASHLPVDLVVHGFDTIHAGGTDGFMNRYGKIGICIECGQHEDPNAEEIAVEAIRQFLGARGHINRVERPSRQQRRLQVDSLYRVKTNCFTFAKRFRDFETLSRGALIATDGDERVIAERDSFIVFAREGTKKFGDEGFCLGHELS